MKISTGSFLDEFLEGGYEKDVITTVYGPAGSGKTLLCMLAAVSVLKSGKKVIYIDTEGGFSIDRFRQVGDIKLFDDILFLKPCDFEEQKKSFEKLKELVNDKIGLVVVDTISMLYRLEMGKSNDVYSVNKELGRQIGYLSEIARRKNIPVLITNQVYADFNSFNNSVNLVGGDIIKYGSKCLIELRKARASNRLTVLKKHRSIKEEKEINFQIIDKGIIPL